MANIPISQLPPVSQVSPAAYVPLDQNGVTSRATVAQIGASAREMDQSFVTVGSESGTLPNSRSAGATNGITKADSGPGGTLTFGLTGQALNFFLLSTTGLTALTGGGNVATRSLVGPGKGFTISNADAVAGNPTFALTGGLLALEDLTGPGVVCSTGTDTYSPRTLTGTANQIDIANSQGAGGDPTFSIASDPRLPGTGGFLPPGGTMAERPLSPPQGFTRRNTTLNVLETWDGAQWVSGVTSVATGTGLTGGPITSTGTISIASTGVPAGTYGDAATVPVPTINAQGQVTAISTATITTEAIGGVPASRTLTAGTGLTGGGNLSADRTFALADTAVTPGNYGNASTVASFTVDQQGRLTAANAATITPAAIGAVPTSRTISAGTGLTGGGSLSADRTFALNVSGVAAGTYNNVTVDVYGRATAGANQPYITGNQTITLYGDASGSGSTSISVTLSNTAVTPGSYGSASQVGTFTVDQKGRLTAAGSATITPDAIGALPMSSYLSDGGTGIEVDPLTLSITADPSGSGLTPSPTIPVWQPAADYGMGGLVPAIWGLAQALNDLTARVAALEAPE